MRYVAAALLSALSGSEPTKDSIKTILSSVGIECDDEKVALVLKEIKGKKIQDLISEGAGKLASVPSGGAAPAAAAAGGGGGAAPAAGKEKSPTKEAKKEEPEEESDDDMGFGLFD